MKSPIFILEGIGGVYNYGCEAIVRGTEVILRRYWPAARIVYHSYRPSDDRQALTDTNIRVEDGTPSRHRIRHLVKRICRRVGCPCLCGEPTGYDWVKRADCVLSIGGDILTLNPKQKDAARFPQADHMVRLAAVGKPVVLWGASVGPFDGNFYATQAFSAALKKLSLITARENITRDYLSRLGVETNVELVADPAFMMEPAENDAVVKRYTSQWGSRTLGINLSPLSIHYVFEETDMIRVPQMQAMAITRLIEAYDAHVVLIPHVICPWRAIDDDVSYLDKVAAAMPAQLAHRVHRLPPGLGGRRTKSIIAHCDGLIAARMHCAISGISSGVPTLFLSYSPKAAGVCEYVYGNRQRVLPLDIDGETLVSAVGRLLEDASEIRRYLKHRLPAVRDDALKAGMLVSNLLSG